jgi:hypothetical protein
MSGTVRNVAEKYATAVSEGDFTRLADLVHPDATFGGTVTAEARGRDAFVQGFRNLRPITVRTDVHEILVDGTRAAILYDLVTDTPAGSILCTEFLDIDERLVTASTLVFDWRRWPEVLEEIRNRVATGS